MLRLDLVFPIKEKDVEEVSGMTTGDGRDWTCLHAVFPFRNCSAPAFT